MRHFVFAVAVAGMSCIAYADEPPSWSGFSVKSENSKFRASVSALDHGHKLEPWEKRYRIQVQKFGRDGSQRMVWEGLYDYDGYAGGTLSNDGEYFAYVDFWYRHTGSAVRIYRRGQSCFFTGQQLGMREDSLEKTISHRVWLNGEPKFVELHGKTVALTIPTVQGAKRIELDPVITYNGTPCAVQQGRTSALGTLPPRSLADTSPLRNQALAQAIRPDKKAGSR